MNLTMIHILTKYTSKKFSYKGSVIHHSLRMHHKNHNDVVINFDVESNQYGELYPENTIHEQVVSKACERLITARTLIENGSENAEQEVTDLHEVCSPETMTENESTVIEQRNGTTENVTVIDSESVDKEIIDILDILSADNRIDNDATLVEQRNVAFSVESVSYSEQFTSSESESNDSDSIFDSDDDSVDQDDIFLDLSSDKQVQQSHIKNFDNLSSSEKATMCLVSYVCRYNFSLHGQLKDLLELLKLLCPDSIALKSLKMKDVLGYGQTEKVLEFHYRGECFELFPDDMTVTSYQHCKKGYAF